MSKLYFFRHGQASLGADNYDVLSSKGKEQAVALGTYLAQKNIQFDRVFVGPLDRQKDTYEAVKNVYAQHNLPLPAAEEVMGLKEHQGIETMKKALPDLLAYDPYLIQLQERSRAKPELAKTNTLLSFQYFLGEWAEGNIIVEGMPTWSSFREEVKRGLEHILKQVKKGETVAAFTSGGTISAITAECLGLSSEKKVADLNFAIRNTAWTTFLYSAEKFNLLTFNELPHLKKEMITFV